MPEPSGASSVPQLRAVDREYRGLSQYYVNQNLVLLPALLAFTAGMLALVFGLSVAMYGWGGEVPSSGDLSTWQSLSAIGLSVGLSVPCFWLAQRLVLHERKILLFLRLFRRADALVTVSRAATGSLGFGFRVVTLDARPVGAHPSLGEDRRIEVGDRADLERAVHVMRQMSGRLLGPNRLLVSVTRMPWQPVVLRLAREATVVLIDVSEPSANLVWELENVGSQVRPRWLLVGEAGAMKRLVAGGPAQDSAAEDLARLLGGEVVLTYRIGEDRLRFKNALRARYEVIKHLRPVAQVGRAASSPPPVPPAAPPTASSPPGGPPSMAGEAVAPSTEGGQVASHEPWWPGGDLGLPPTGRGSVATIGERIRARGIDVLVCGFLALALFGVDAGVRALLDVRPSGDDALSDVVAGVIWALVLGYDPVMTALLGATPGKLATDLDVVSEHRLRSASLVVLAARSLLLFAMWFCCFCLLGALDATAANADPHRRTWHDRATGTIVLRAGGVRRVRRFRRRRADGRRQENEQ
jgi:uncharacterized RDD family membrane protein YckC